MMIYKIALFLLISLLPATSYGQITYNYYFSNEAIGNAAGDDITGDGSIGTPWKTLDKAQVEINAASSIDTVNLYFDRGDTWKMDTAAVSKPYYDTHGLLILDDDPAVNIYAYGSGDLSKPCFDGLVTDFSAVPVHNATTGPLRWSRIFSFGRDNCSVQYIEIKGVYGEGIVVEEHPTDEAAGTPISFTIRYCDINNFGQTGILIKNNIDGAVVEYNTVHTGQQLARFDKRGSWGWGAAIRVADGSDYSDNNEIRYNVVYDIYGEGIILHGGVAEYNIVGDTYSTAIYHNGKGSSYAGYSEDTIFRYNYVMSTSSPTYRTADDSAYNGIGYVEEFETTADNSEMDLEIYGNIVINRYYGIYAKVQSESDKPVDGGVKAKTLKIYNNLVIDCWLANYTISNPDKLTDAGYIYNNSSILYDRPTRYHNSGDQYLPHANWTVSNNHFWTEGDPTPIIDDGWSTNAVYGDPKLAGESKGTPTDWDNLQNYWEVTFADITPESGSALYNAGATLSAVDYAVNLFATGTSWGETSLGIDPTLANQTAGAPVTREIGAVTPSGGVGPSYYISEPYPSDNATGVHEETALTWNNPADTVTVDIWFNGVKEEDDVDVETYSHSSDFVFGSNNTWQVDVNHASGTTIGVEYSFTVRPNPTVIVDFEFSKFSGIMKFHKNAGIIRR